MHRYSALLLALCLGASTAESVLARDKTDLGCRGTEVDAEALADFTNTLLAAIEVLHAGHVRPVARGELLCWAIEGLYSGVNEEIPKWLIDRLRKHDSLQKKDLGALLSSARKHLGRHRDLEGLRDIDRALDGIFRKLEPRAQQQPQKDLRSRPLCILPAYPPTGIGLQLVKEPHTGQLQVVTTIKDGPAYLAKVVAEDLVTSIVSEDAEGDEIVRRTLSPKEFPIAKAEEQLLGKPGTKVWLTIQRSGEAKPFEIAVVRGPAEPETVLGVRRKADDSWDFMLDLRSKVGYVRVVRFGRHTGRDLARACACLDEQQIKGLILDLRSTDGGLISAALSVGSHFVDDGTFVTLKGRAVEDSWQIDTTDKRTKVPMVCLVNGRCVGVSEAVAACLQDHRRAAVVGERSAGEVGFDFLAALKGGQIRFTHAVMVRPSGKNMDKILTTGRETEAWGVIPDKGLEVKLSPRESASLEKHFRLQEIIRRPDQRGASREAAFTDRQLQVALSYLLRQLPSPR